MNLTETKNNVENGKSKTNYRSNNQNLKKDDCMF